MGYRGGMLTVMLTAAALLWASPGYGGDKVFGAKTPVVKGGGDGSVPSFPDPAETPSHDPLPLPYPSMGEAEDTSRASRKGKAEPVPGSSLPFGFIRRGRNSSVRSNSLLGEDKAAIRNGDLSAPGGPLEQSHGDGRNVLQADPSVPFLPVSAEPFPGDYLEGGEDPADAEPLPMKKTPPKSEVNGKPSSPSGDGGKEPATDGSQRLRRMHSVVPAAGMPDPGSPTGGGK